MTQPYQRVLLKLSGEAFGGGKLGVDPVVVSGIAREVAEDVHGGTQVAWSWAAATTSGVQS